MQMFLVHFLMSSYAYEDWFDICQPPIPQIREYVDEDAPGISFREKDEDEKITITVTELCNAASGIDFSDTVIRWVKNALNRTQNAGEKTVLMSSVGCGSSDYLTRAKFQKFVDEHPKLFG